MNTRSGGDGNTGAGTPDAPSENENAGAPGAAEEPTKGLDAALARLRAEFGEDVVTLWRSSGPRKGHVAEVACVLAEIGDYPRKLIVQAHTGGSFKLYAEVSGKSHDQMVESLKTLFDVVAP